MDAAQARDCAFERGRSANVSDWPWLVKLCGQLGQQVIFMSSRYLMPLGYRRQRLAPYSSI